MANDIIDFTNPDEVGEFLLNITVRRSRLSGVARATIPDKQSHHVMRYCAFAGSKP